MMRKVPTDSNYAVRGDVLRKMIEEDKAAGLVPFYVRQRKYAHAHKHTHAVNPQTESHTSGSGLLFPHMVALQATRLPTEMTAAQIQFARDVAVHTPRLQLKDNMVSGESNICLSG